MTRLQGNIPLIGQQSQIEAVMQERFNELMVDREFSLFRDLLTVEYGRARAEHAKELAKNPKAKFNVNIAIPMQIASRATIAFGQLHYGPPKKSDKAAAEDLRKETEAGEEVSCVGKIEPAPEAEPTVSPGGIILGQ